MTANAVNIREVLANYLPKVESALKDSVSYLGPKTPLREASDYVLSGGGKRIRPAIVLMVAEALTGDVSAETASLVVEYFHAASLVADDLPCMDDDGERRGRPSVHVIYGEAMALLVSYTLIAAGYEWIHRASRIMDASVERRNEVCYLALESATYNTGVLGATGGQFWDLKPPDHSEETVAKVIQMKTVSLFEIAFVHGWLFGGGDVRRLEEVKQLAHHFGMAFQICDDVDDMAQDDAAGDGVNYAVCFGRDQAISAIRSHVQAYLDLLEKLEIKTQSLVDLGCWLELEAKRAST